MKWIKIKDKTPQHKDLVLCNNGKITLPAIYYKNQSFDGFYHYTTAYEIDVEKVYSKVKLKDNHKIKNVVKWKLIK